MSKLEPISICHTQYKQPELERMARTRAILCHGVARIEPTIDSLHCTIRPSAVIYSVETGKVIARIYGEPMVR